MPPIPFRMNPTSEHVGIPESYTELPYIESTGYQYIDTEWVGTLGTSVHVRCTPINTTYRCVVGMRGPGDTLTRANIAINIGWQSSTANFLSDFNFQNDSRHSFLVPDFGSVYKSLVYDIYLDKNNSNLTVYKDGEVYCEDNKSYPTPSFDPTAAINMCLLTSAPFASGSWAGWTGRIYECQIKNEGVLVRNFIPALDFTGRPCMYDTVEKRPFYNQTAIEFKYPTA